MSWSQLQRRLSKAVAFASRSKHFCSLFPKDEVANILPGLELWNIKIGSLKLPLFGEISTDIVRECCPFSFSGGNSIYRKYTEAGKI